MNGSCEMRQATATDGKLPHALLGPKREEPSRRRLTAASQWSLRL